jgi:acyl-CoA synthetase (AMP-forming)/AMP-acid ligase II
MIDPTTRYLGYYKQPDASEKKVAYNVVAKGDQYFRTGDLLRVTYDGLTKFAAFEDRIGDTFRWKGENVSTMVIL